MRDATWRQLAEDKFLEALSRHPLDNTLKQKWATLLGPVEPITARFLSEGLLEDAPLAQKLAYTYSISNQVVKGWVRMPSVSPLPGGAVVGAARTVGIREAFASAPSGMTKGELSIALRARKSVISRLLSTLAAHRYASPHPTGRFRLGLPVLAAALRYADRLGFPGICMPVLQRMADETGELVQLAVVQDGRLLSVAKAEGHDQRIRIVSVIGQTRPLHATASGKAYLASRPEDAALMLARRHGLTPLTRKTLTSLDNLRKELLRVRRQGYAIVEEEFVEGGGAVAAAISVLCLKGRVVGAIGISGPEFRFSLPRKREVAPMVLAAAARVVEIWPLDLEDRPVSVAFPEGVR